MLPKKNRLTRKQFPLVVRAPAYHSPYFTLRCREGAAVSQFAVVVSSTVAKKATVRNRVRRRLYQSLRTLLPDLPKGLSGAIFVKKEALKLSSRELIASLHALLKKIDQSPRNGKIVERVNSG